MSTNATKMKIHPRMKTLAYCVSIALAQLAINTAYADSAVGNDTVIGNAMNPGYPGTPVVLDSDAVAAKHSPSGQLYGIPSRAPEEGDKTTGFVEIGVLGGDGNLKNAQFRQYKDLRNGVYLNNFGLQMEQPDDAHYINISGGGVGQNDQFYSMQTGRYNDWKVKAFYNETPHVFTDTYRSLWNGLNTGNQTLINPALLVPGGGAAGTAASVGANISAVLKNTPNSELEVNRNKGGVRFDKNLADSWKFYASYTDEKREGARPYGMVWGGGGGSNNIEIAEPIDYNTRDFMTGVQYVDELNSVNLAATVSRFTNNINTLTVQSPMAAPAANGIAAGGFTQAVFDLYPSNTYYDVKAEYARELPDFYKGHFNGDVSWSSSRQNDNLIPATSLAGVVVNGVAGGAWDTTASLSKQTAGAKIDMKLVDLGLSFKPVDALDVKGKLRYYETSNSTEYWACNPLTGQWGRITNDGSGSAIAGILSSTTGAAVANSNLGSALPLASRCNAATVETYNVANNILPSAGNVNIRNIPYEYKQLNYGLSADYRLGKAASVNAAYDREEFRREFRERDKTWEDKIKLGYTNRGIENATLRLSYEYDNRRGSTYITDPYEAFYSASLGPQPSATLPSAVPAAGFGVTGWIHNNEQFRKFDLADRNQNILNGRFNYMVMPNLDAGVNLQLKDIDYPSDYGRDMQRQDTLSFDLNYQPSAELSVTGFYTYQDSRMKQHSVQQNTCSVGLTYYFWSNGLINTTAIGAAAPAAPAGSAAGATIVGTQNVTGNNWGTVCGNVSATSPLYPTARAFEVSSKDRNDMFGLGAKYDFSKAKLGLDYTYSKGRTEIDYSYNALALIGTDPTRLAQAGSGMPDMEYTQNVLSLSLLIPVSKQMSTRLMYRFEDVKIRDWHYDGVAANPVPSNSATVANNGAAGVNLDSGPQDFKSNMFGVMLQFKM